MFKAKLALVALISGLGLMPLTMVAQEKTPAPYFVTYDHYLEEADELEIESSVVLGRAQDLNSFLGSWTEFEYGARKWWTTELYIDWQHTRHEGSVFTGYKWENRFRPFLESHKINPVLYVEYEHLNGADKTLKEIVGFDSKADLEEPNSVTREEKEHEIETKLILSSDIGEWNLAENFIGTKNLHGEQWEFGYTVGVSRPLGTAKGNPCTFCAENFSAGVEAYGGLGTWSDFTFRGTSQYIAPVFLWKLPRDFVIRVSPGWGVTDESVGTLFRFGVSKGFDDFGRGIAKMFGKL